MTLAEQKKKILKQLDALKIFSNTSTVKKLRQELISRLAKMEARIEQGREVKLPISKAEIQKAANETRAGKMRKYHNYVRQIRNSFPDLTYSQIRQEFKERKKGKDVEIPDVIWQNPSP